MKAMGTKHYPAEYKQRVVALIRAGRSATEVAHEFKLNVSTVCRWVHQAEVDGGMRDGVTTDEKAELTRLRREVADLREEKEILKKFAAWSAQEANWTPRKRSGS
jgi:transposase